MNTLVSNQNKYMSRVGMEERQCQVVTDDKFHS